MDNSMAVGKSTLPMVKMASEAHYRMGRRSGEWKMRLPGSVESVESMESAITNKPIFTCLVDLDGNIN